MPRLPFDEQARSLALHQYEILDTPPEDEFNDIAAIAAEVCQAPIALVNFVDTHRQFFKAQVGPALCDTALDTSFCGKALLSDGLMIVPDTHRDPRFDANPLVRGTDGVRFYAGALLKTRGGFPIGTVCVLDKKPRELDSHQIRTLRLLARQAMTQVELRASLAATQRLAAHHRQVIDSSVDYAILSLDLAGNVTAWNQGAENVFGWTEHEMQGRPGTIIFNSVDRTVGIPDMEMATARAEGRAADERWHVRKDGSRFFALGEMMLLKDDADQHVGYVKILRDRTHARRQAQRLSLLSQASSALLSTDDPAATLGPILEGGTDTIGFEQCYLYDIAPDRQHLLLRHSVGVAEETRMALDNVAFDVPLCGIVAETAEPLVLSDLHVTREPRHQIARTTGLRAYAGFPICVRDRAVGVISFGSAEVNSFDEEALSFFQTIARFLSVARERADDARALRDAEQRSRLAQEAGGVGTFEIDVATATVVGSSEFFRIFGVPAQERASTRLFQEIVMIEDRELASRDALHPEGTAPSDVEYRIRRADDGKLRWIARRAEFIRDDTGRIRAMCGTVQDITDKKMAALRQEALLDLGNSVRHAITPEEMIELACGLVLKTLDATRAGYAVVDRRAGRYIVTGECVAEGAGRLYGSYELSDFEDTTAQLETGQPLVLNDAVAEVQLAGDLDNYLANRVAAQISVPQMRQEELIGALYVHQNVPRHWTAGEVDFMRRVADRLYAALATARAEKEQAVLNHELSHRLKNSLSMVQAIASQTLRAATDKTALQDFLRRMQALSAAHDVLLHRNWEAGSIRQTIQSTLAPLVGPERIRTGGPDVDLGARSTLSLSMLLHELATNAVKYGCLSVDAGLLHVVWHIEDVSEGERDLVVVWQEAGGPEVHPPTRKGFGSRLIQMGLTGTGGVELSYDPSGFVATIRAPLSELRQS
ncbi:GAF domain-containing protein [Falsirhodobacter sp. 1013]|uniref:GAF domain-containing protein n=1 Tax=Falsirhodobacter sp. 1013 TaxID=3417566 RepID=UPI003EBCA7CB